MGVGSEVGGRDGPMAGPGVPEGSIRWHFGRYRKNNKTTVFCVPKCKFRIKNECRRSMHVVECISKIVRIHRGFMQFGNRSGIMPLFDANMIGIKPQKSAPGDRRFCYKSSIETQNSASPTTHRRQEGRDMLDMRNCAFRSVNRAKT